ncbi:Bug family tripartite tricarboxylate transporter substrate binding protein [Bordetella tumulicola]|uniref:Bug family tripartite tricarboxylate transporter substrate binding protein n=1 Tax=Bordetella tumulicola TaxID=1649133 RepID=UPI0039F07547
MYIRSLIGLTLACALAATPAAQAQDAPIHIIVPLAGGGGTDVLARVIAAKMRDSLGQNVIVENRAGAAGNIGADAVYRAAPDGHTLLFTQPGPLVVNQWLYAKLGFKPERFEPIAMASSQDIMLAIGPQVPAKTLPELIAYAKANPGKLNYGSSGVGSAPHLAAELFQSMAGIKMEHVPYKGSSESMNATLGGQVDLTFFAFSSALPHARAGKLRALAVGGAKRNPQLPEVPAIAEVLPGYNAASWTGLVAPPGTPESVTKRLAQAMQHALKEPYVQRRLIDAGDEPVFMTRDEMDDYLAQERKRWHKVIQAVGIKAE